MCGTAPGDCVQPSVWCYSSVVGISCAGACFNRPRLRLPTRVHLRRLPLPCSDEGCETPDLQAAVSGDDALRVELVRSFLDDDARPPYRPYRVDAPRRGPGHAGRSDGRGTGTRRSERGPFRSRWPGILGCFLVLPLTSSSSLSSLGARGGRGRRRVTVARRHHRYMDVPSSCHRRATRRRSAQTARLPV